ncbi:MAG: hypothetical protein PUA61_08065 [Succinatimonas hippei]|nr:hypothetical protein [Succinatimonas hippei]
MLDIEDFDLEKFSNEVQDDVGLLQYLYYDLRSDLEDDEMQDTYFGETFEDVKELTEKVLKKYNAEGILDLNVFNRNFSREQYLNFYDDINQVYTKIIENERK